MGKPTNKYKTKKYNYTQKSVNLNIPLILGVVVVLVAGSLVALGVYHSRRNTTGHYFEARHAPIPIIDVYEDPLCPYCGFFEQSHGGKLIGQSLITGKALVEYHITNTLDKYSASKNYSSRVYASLLAIEKSTLPKKDRTKLWHDYHETIFSAGFQPKENAPTDHDNKQLAGLISRVAQADGIKLPDDLIKSVESGKYVTEATNGAKANFQELQMRKGSSVPSVFGNGTLYSIIADPRKVPGYQAKDDITRPEFVTGLTLEVENFNAPTIEVFEDPLCPMCGFYERTEGAVALRKQASAGRVRIQYRLINYLDQGSVSKDYSTRADSALYAVEKAKLSPEDKLTLWTDYHSSLFSARLQPEEQGSTDLSNKQLADELILVANNDGITIPKNLPELIEKGHYVPEVKKKARGNLFVMQSHSINGTPTLWGKGQQYGLKIDVRTGKTAAGADPNSDISNPAFVTAYIYGIKAAIPSPTTTQPAKQSSTQSSTQSSQHTSITTKPTTQVTHPTTATSSSAHH